MRFATYSVDGKMQYGAVRKGGMIALSPEFPQWPTLREVIADDGFNTLKTAATGRDVTHEDGTYRYEIPVPRPEKIICVGVNYPDRNSEYRDGSDAPKHMSLFVRFARSFVGHGAALTRPKASNQLDYEGEVVIVIGKGGRHIPVQTALDHVAAITISNEGSVRDWIRHAKFNVTQGKNFEGSGSIGPWLVPFRSDEQLVDIKLETRVNGEVRQSDRTSRMVFSHADEIAYISTFTELVPGDVIISGTPTGAGARFDPPKFLKPGDVVEVEVEGVGILHNGIVDE